MKGPLLRARRSIPEKPDFVLNSGKLLVRVNKVRVQSKLSGVIFCGQQVMSNGELSHVDEDVTVRLHRYAAAGAVVREGQRWRVEGRLSRKEFTTPRGFTRREKTIDVPQGYAEMVKPSGRLIVDYLSGHSDLPGIGPATANKLWDTFGHQLYDMLDQADYRALVDVLAPAKVAMLIEVWARDDLSQTIQWLAQHDIDPQVGRKLVQIHGSQSRQRVEENCYRLLSYAAKWKQVDALACNLGMTWDDPRRLAAACEQVIYDRFGAGNTVVPQAELRQRLKALLDCPAEDSGPAIEAALVGARQSGRVLFDSGENACGMGPALLERQVAMGITRLLGLPAEKQFDLAGIVSAVEEAQGFRLNPEQRMAVDLVAKHRFSVITGGAGCGKTTVLRVVCEVLEAQGYEVIQLALAGKAVRRMVDATGRKAQTIASFVKAHKGLMERQASPPEASQCDAKLAVVIDEASMVDLISFAAVLRTIGGRCKVVLVGDPNQLPPVGPGLILHHLACGVVPHVHLGTTNRFGSDIAEVANEVRDGRMPCLTANAAVALLEPEDPSHIAEMATSLYLSDQSDAIVLCPSNALVDEINKMIQRRTTWNNQPVTVWNHQFDCRQDLGLRLGDPVICGRNHWDRGLQNGSIGRIKVIDMMDEDEVSGVIEWDDGVERAFDMDLLEDLSLAYAVTVHKSQGSQWRRVIVAIREGKLLDRSLVYTAITRATKEVQLIGMRAVIEGAIHRPKAADLRKVGIKRWIEYATS
ncbi:AAA family ATPase [Niveibacterium umoris]|uniref:Exodeoxyribonuclease V alpha subunit n=1 Tax=Niveibacterium umoris TaxID=1193620 RepID=A0A840BEB0_9RHOO|nr:exodeoxyribonuclease V alpha subunit [Niveibacterium umoris]